MVERPRSRSCSERREITVPTKPNSEVINAAKVKLDPREVLEVVINETPALRDDLLKAGLVEEVEE